MTAAIGRAMVSTVLREPDPRAATVSQLVAGECAAILETHGSWRRLRLAEDGTIGWVHAGCLRELLEGEATSWRSRAAWSTGAVVMVGTQRRWLPLRARVALADGEVELPGGETGRVVAGAVRPTARLHLESRQHPPEEWAATCFAGAPWLWGGVTPGGVDDSGLVHTTWLARGVVLPRDAAGQAGMGQPVPPDAIRAGDLLFFHTEAGSAIAHVAIAGPDATLVHSHLGAGGVVTESRLPGQPAAALMSRLAVVRRLSEPDSARAA